MVNKFSSIESGAVRKSNREMNGGKKTFLALTAQIHFVADEEEEIFTFYLKNSYYALRM
jgi:hypothetical protein